MPEYAYWCPSCSKAATKWFSISGRQEAVECPSCGDEAKRDPAAWDKHRRVNPDEVKVERSISRGNSVNWREVVCECGHTDIEDFTDEQLDEPFACEKCGEEMTKKWIGSSSRTSEMYPYFDRGLGMWLKSAQHRRDVCKARGITPVEGDWDVDDAFRKEASSRNRAEQDYADYEYRLQHDPAFAQLRRAEAEGRFQ